MAKHQTSAQSRRAQLQAQKAQQEAARLRRRMIAIIVGVVAVAVVLVGVVWWQTSRPQTPQTPADPANPTFIPPDGADNFGWIEVRGATVKPGALTVDEHTDYQCPWCQLADQFFGSPLRALAENGDIVLRMHLRTLLGDLGLKNDSSRRSAMAAACADTVGKFMDYHETVFSNQPDEGVGYTDQQLRVDYARQAGISGQALATFQYCYDSQQTMAYVLAMEQINWSSTTINGSTQEPVHGTPTFFVNGKPMTLSSMLTQSGQSYAPAFDTSPAGMLAHLQEVAAR